MKCRGEVLNLETWKKMKIGEKFKTGLMYKELSVFSGNVPWKKLFYGNLARPRAMFVLWMVCFGRLYTKDHLRRIGIVNDGLCGNCNEEESINHLFFNCRMAKRVWERVLRWIGLKHEPGEWEEELKWVLHEGNKKNSRSRVLKCAIAETVYAIWEIRNLKMHGKGVEKPEMWLGICRITAARCARVNNLKAFIKNLDSKLNM